jgi:hypothetical protein
VPSEIAIQDSYVANWDFIDALSLPSIYYLDQVAGDGRMHLSIQFIGQDATGNFTPTQDVEELGIVKGVLDPLHIWWIINNSSRLLPNRSGTTVQLDDLAFQFELDRAYNLATVGQPDPVYSYSIWRSIDPGPNGRGGPYEPVPSFSGWSPWTTLAQVTPDVFASLGEGRPGRGGGGDILGRWVILVLASIDEAGNVEQWPAALDATTGEIIMDPGAISGSNWQNFYVTNTNAPDTALSGTFWWNNITNGDPRAIEPRAGELIVAENSSLIPSPVSIPSQRVEAAFTISSPGFSGGGFPKYLWELVRDGDEANKMRGTISSFSSTGAVTLVLPVDLFSGGLITLDNNSATPEEFFTLWSDGSYRFEDARNAVNYVLRVAAWDDAGGTGPPDAGELDPTPANYPFTVVPSTNVGDYTDPKDTPDQQPIREIEQR